MNITTETHGRALVFRLNGRLDGRELESAVADRVGGSASAFSEVVLDLGGVDYIYSDGLRALLRLARAQRKAGRGFAACSLTKSVADVLEMTGFSQIMDIHPDLGAALAEPDEPNPSEDSW